MNLDGRHALVTGGGTGIGAAIAKSLSRAGARVTVVGRRREPLENVAGGLNQAMALSADVTDEAAVSAMVRDASAAMGPVDILVANAGAAASASVVKTSLDLWQSMLSVNLTSAFLSSRAVLPAMIGAGWGRVVFIASTASLAGAPYIAAYSAAKHGVLGLARSLALETAGNGVTVNAVCPGYTETPMLQQTITNIMDKTGRDEAAARAAVLGGNPQGRFIQPDEVAETVLWLCGDGARSVTGQAVAISGGEI